MRNWNFQSTLCSHSFSFHSATLEDSRFTVGERVCVKQSCSGRPPSMWRRPHWPVPGKLEAPGRVVKKLGMRSDPTFFTFCEELGLAKVDTEEPCYLVEFPLPQGDPRKKETRADGTKETICLEVFQSWLQQEAQQTGKTWANIGILFAVLASSAFFFADFLRFLRLLFKDFSKG